MNRNMWRVKETSTGTFIAQRGEDREQIHNAHCKACALAKLAMERQTGDIDMRGLYKYGRCFHNLQSIVATERGRAEDLEREQAAEDYDVGPSTMAKMTHALIMARDGFAVLLGDGESEEPVWFSKLPLDRQRVIRRGKLAIELVLIETDPTMAKKKKGDRHENEQKRIR